jgi:hypothetical protein
MIRVLGASVGVNPWTLYIAARRAGTYKRMRNFNMLVRYRNFSTPNYFSLWREDDDWVCHV